MKVQSTGKIEDSDWSSCHEKSLDWIRKRVLSTKSDEETYRTFFATSLDPHNLTNN